MKLNRDLIIGAALDVVDREGWDALSMRRLAQELDVWPMAVYRHFRDKDELLDTIADAAAERVAIPSKRGSWRSQMRELLGGVRESVERYPGGARSSLTPGGPRTTEAALRILEEGGFDRGEAVVRAWRTLFAYAAGFAVLAWDDDEEFNRGLDSLFDGLESRLGGRGSREPAR